ncbi:MAG: hypothetical protein EP326_06610 [Deltaproteobacteria bacterium]|nr:MAG: hypothetical protein EP326_06610 [Deltaproteobacteria bacterium]TNF31337.1 MAG: hypothetical protein EP319_02425 [Deltaproteobacteria bacterium]
MSEENNTRKSDGNSGPRKRNNRNRRRRPSGNKSNNPNNPQAKQTQGQNRSNTGVSAAGKSNSNTNNKKRRRRRRRPSDNLSPLEKLFRKYENLLEQHLVARKKYYEFFHRADPKQKVKLEGNFTRTIKELRDFELSLEGEEKTKFIEKYDSYTLDTTYTSNRAMPIEGDRVETKGEFEDPHYLPSQAESDFSQDTEESMGTMDDYLAYKGLN